MAMLFSIIIPAISQYVYRAIKIYIDFNTTVSFVMEFIIQVFCPYIIFICITKTIERKSDEFRCMRICKNILEELEKEKLEEIRNESNEISEDLKEIKNFFGI